jgi:hypothetical protein
MGGATCPHPSRSREHPAKKGVGGSRLEKTKKVTRKEKAEYAKCAVPHIPRRIEIPFREDMRLAVSQKRKFCTTRSKKYGEPGDFFELMSEDGSHHDYLLIAVRRHTLNYVVHNLWCIEGCANLDEFLNLWDDIHKRKEYDPEQKLWTHYFIPMEV